jgi:hypothetical protein
MCRSLRPEASWSTRKQHPWSGTALAARMMQFRSEILSSPIPAGRGQCRLTAHSGNWARVSHAAKMQLPPPAKHRDLPDLAQGFSLPRNLYQRDPARPGLTQFAAVEAAASQPVDHAADAGFLAILVSEMTHLQGDMTATSSAPDFQMPAPHVADRRRWHGQGAIAEGILRIWPVDKRVGNVRNDGPELLEPEIPPEPDNRDAVGPNPL